MTVKRSITKIALERVKQQLQEKRKHLKARFEDDLGPEPEFTLHEAIEILFGDPKAQMQMLADAKKHDEGAGTSRIYLTTEQICEYSRVASKRSAMIEKEKAKREGLVNLRLAAVDSDIDKIIDYACFYGPGEELSTMISNFQKRPANSYSLLVARVE